MAYITEMDPGFTLDVGIGEIINTGSLDLLNAFGAAETVSGYDPAPGDSNLVNGEPLGVSTVEGSSHSGTYLGDLTLSTLNTTILNVGVASLSVAVNPIEGELYQDDSGSLYMISDDPVNDARISVSATVTILGIPTSINLPLEDLEEWVEGIPGIGGLLSGVTNLTQRVLDTVVVSMDYDPDGGMIVCFTRGTLIATEHGARRIEELQAGDRVFTLDNGMKEIRWIGVAKISNQKLTEHPNLRPIRIAAGALGQNTPKTDLLVSPQHRILVRSKIAQRMFDTSEILVAAKQLLQLEGVDIVDDGQDIEYYHFLLDQHEVILANGTETETLFTGEQALKSVGQAARDEIFALFPQLQAQDYVPIPARTLPTGRASRKLVARHLQNNKSLVM